MPSPFPKARIGALLLAAILLTATGLLAFQYFHNRSLWLDEAMLSLNIIKRDFSGLLKPLDYTQVAPVLFLLIEKCFTMVLGTSELALRLFPLLCAIAALPLFYQFSVSLTKNNRIALIAICLLGCTPKFIYYASEVKQYAGDVFVISAIYFTAFAGNAFLKKHRRVILSITGVLAVFLSNISVIPLFTIGLLFLYRSFRDKKNRATLLVPLIVWTICLSINYFIFIRNHPYAPVMKEYWKDSFLPANPLQASFTWLNFKVHDVFYNLLPSFSLPGSFTLLHSFALSITLYTCSLLYLLLAKKFKLFYLCVAPIAIHLLLSALKIYPFDLRLILYQVPLYLIVIACGLYQLSSLFLKCPFLQYTLLGLFVAGFSLRAFKEIPINNEEIRPMISDINQNIQPGQTVYIYYGSKPAFLYYRETGYARFGTARVLSGESHLNDNEGYVAELQLIKGPTWLLFSHIYPFDGSRGEDQYMLKGLIHRGTLIKEFQSFGSSAYLFDLK